MHDLTPSRVARLFWAIGLDENAAAFAQGECARLAPRLLSAKIRWQPCSNWHMTLVFLGNMTVGDGLAMADALRVPVAALDVFDVVMAPAQWFPTQEHPRVIALRVQENAPLLALNSMTATAVLACGYPHEPRPFLGHVSIARVKHGYRPRDPLPAGEGSARLRVDHVALYESISTADGPRYEPILKLPLRAAPR